MPALLRISPTLGVLGASAFSLVFAAPAFAQDLPPERGGDAPSTTPTPPAPTPAPAPIAPPPVRPAPPVSPSRSVPISPLAPPPSAATPSGIPERGPLPPSRVPEKAATPTEATPLPPDVERREAARIDTGAPEIAQGNAMRAVVFPEERTPPGFDENGNALPGDQIRFALHGYFRAPFRMSWRRRSDAASTDHKYDLRTPWLVDDDYYQSGFAYTPNMEQDFSELYLNMGNRNLTATVQFQGSLYSDTAKPIIDDQLGIAQGYLTYRWAHDLSSTLAIPAKLRVRVKGGAFWDRFGWIQKYDTYLFGRTHQIGEQVRAELDLGRFTFALMEGIGAHLEDLSTNQGLTLLQYVHAGVAYDRRVELGLYQVRSWTQDRRQLNQDLVDGTLDVDGVDLRLQGGPAGLLYVAGSYVDADKVDALSPALELMHSYGGRGLTENFFGTKSSDHGTGSLYNLAFQYDLSAASILKSVSPAAYRSFAPADVTLSLFGLYSYVRSKQADPDPAVNRDERKYFKYGAELAAWPISWLGFSMRYDRVVMNVDDDANTFRILSPRVTLRTHWYGDAAIFLQWSRYIYGDRVTLRPGQIALETQPDDNAVKIQAQMSF